MPHTLHYVTVLLFAALTSLTACNKQSDTKPPERVTQITTANAKTMNLPIVESAAGAETALGIALDYDSAKKVGNGTFFVRLAFPEHVANRLTIGQDVRLSSFGDEGKWVPGTIREIRPALNATTLSREVIVAVSGARNWRPSGSVRGDVTMGIHKNAIVVPEQAVVLRPSGTVVYAIENGVAREQRVKTGLMRDGNIEITEGLQAGTSVAVDGAALLSDGAKVNSRNTTPQDGARSP